MANMGKVIGGPVHPDLARFNVKVGEHQLYTNVAIVESKVAGTVILETAKGHQYRVPAGAIQQQIAVSA